MSKTRLLFLEAGVALKEVTVEHGQTILARAYAVSTKRTSEVWQSSNLEQALRDYNAELDRCTNLAFHR